MEDFDKKIKAEHDAFNQALGLIDHYRVIIHRLRTNAKILSFFAILEAIVIVALLWR